MDSLVIFFIVASIILFFFGAAVYSFLNVVIFRVPRGEEFVKTRSHCPGCGKVLTPLELIPVVSYLCLGGKCKKCGSKIGIRDVSIEIFGGLSAIASFLFAIYGRAFVYSMVDSWLGRNAMTDLGLMEISYGRLILCIALRALAYFSIIGALTVICFINIDTGKVPTGTLIAFVVVGVFGVIAMPQMEWLTRLLGLAGGAGIFLFLGLMAKDRELLAGAVIAGTAGAVLGWHELLATAIVAVLIGALVAICLLLTGNKKLQDRFKPIPILCVSLVIGLFLATQISGLLMV